jgi:hypothetical protein
VRGEVDLLDTLLADAYAEYYAEGDLPFIVPSEAGLRRIRSRIQEAKSRSTRDRVGDFWAAHFTELIQALESAMEEDLERPFRIMDQMASALRVARAYGGRDGEEAKKRLQSKFGTAVDALTEVSVIADKCSERDSDLMARSAGLLREELLRADAVGEWLPERERESMEELTARIAIASRAGGTREPSVPRDFPDVVRRSYAWDIDQILSWYEEDLSYCLNEFNEIAAGIDPHRTPLEILAQDLGACSSAEEMFRLARQYVATAKQVGSRYVTLPEDERMMVRPLSPAFQITCPWGVYNSEEMTPQNLVGWLELNDKNFRAVTRGWLEMMAVHEGYPGHHAHFAKTKSSRTLPKSFKTNTSAADYLIEGIAHRSERLLEGIFPEPAYRLFVAYRRLHCVMRIKAEVDLHLYGRPPEDTVRDYMTVMGFDRPSAQVQTQAHFVQPGRAFSYYTGQKVLEECREQLGTDPATYTELIFSHGNVSLGTMLSIVRMGEEGRCKIMRREVP